MAGDTRTIRVVVTGDSSSAQRSLKALHKEASKNNTAFSGMGSFMATWAKRGALAMGGAAAAAGMLGLKTASTMQQARIGFTNMLGSAEKAEGMLKGLADFAAKTPFEFPELVKSSQRMMAMGFQAKDVIPTLTAVGDAVAAMGGSSESIQFITRALGQMQTKGKVSGEEVRQLAEQGIPVWKILASTMGKTTGEVMKLAEQGKITADFAIPALVKGIEEGTASTKKFGGMMEAQSKTIQGRFSTLKDNVKMALGELMEKTFPVLGAAMAGVTNAIESLMAAFKNKAPVDGVRNAFYELGLGIRLLIQSFKDGKVTSGGFLGVMQRLGTIVKWVWERVTAFGKFLSENGDTVKVFVAVLLTAVVAWKLVAGAIALTNAVMAMNPIALVVAGLVVLITWLVRTYQTNEDFREKVDAAWKAIKETVSTVWNFLKGVFKWISSTITEINEEWNTFSDTVRDAWENIKGWTRKGAAWIIDKMVSFGISLLKKAEWAFGWIPGIGKKLTDARKKLEKFRDDANKALNGIDGETVTVLAKFSTSMGPGYRESGGRIDRYAYGGKVSGGIPGRDSVPAMLMPDEFVVRRDGSNLIDALMYYGAKGMAAGGLVVNASTPSFGTMNAKTRPIFQRMAQQWADSSIGQALASASMGGSGVSRWAPLVLRVLSELRQPLSFMGAVLRRIQLESGGNPNAINLWDSNARAGHPSMGLMQTIAGTFAAYAGPYRGLGQMNPLASIYAGLNYAIQRYGSIGAIDPRVRPYGYDNGGMLPTGLSLAYNGTGRPEPVGHGLGTTINVTVNVAGSVTTERDLVKSVTLGVRDELLRHANRNGGRTGLPPQ